GGSGAYSALNPSARPVFVAEAASGAYSNAPGGSSGHPAALVTGAPTTQTPAPAKRTSTGAIVAATFAALVVLGIGGAVAVKKLTATPVAATGGSTPPVSAPPSVIAAPVTAAPVAAPEPSPTPSAAPSASVEASEPPKPIAKPAAVVPKPPPVVVVRPPVNRPPGKPAEKPAAKPGNDIGF
ncbi:MAG: hypothetical protein ABW061_23240, partial [Polyangiaceae bacterium]